MFFRGILERLTWFVDLMCRVYDKFFMRHNSLPMEDIYSLYTIEMQKKNESRIRSKTIKNVAFFCMDIAMWKYETIYSKMLKDPNYNPLIFIAPRVGIWKERKMAINSMKSYFDSKGYQYINLKSEVFNIGQKILNYELDFVFFTQPYNGLLCKEYSFDKFANSLLVYVPYAYIIGKKKFNYDSLLSQIAWKVFLPNNCNINDAQLFEQKVSNIIITGYPGYDIFKVTKPLDWKNKDLKKVIWAPHFSISKDGWLHLSNFLEIFEYMQHLAVSYKKEVQIAFKPHPHLYSSLCGIWGRKKTDSYFDWWKSGETTLLYTGECYSIFKSSDALIHDCGSFIMEYMYTQKPCLYIDLNKHNDLEPNESGCDSLNAHYFAYKKEDIDSFINRVVLKKGNDLYLDKRQAVLKKYIIPHNGYSATDNILFELHNI